jgi:thiamine-phosphate pyrophosphorylase
VTRPFRFPTPIYPIVDPAARAQGGAVDLAEVLLAAGAELLQLRMKSEPTGRFVDTARAVKAAADRRGIPLVINDRADVAALIGAAGVHLGQEDLPTHEARRLLGEDRLIGFSTHDPSQVEQAMRSVAADYLAFGPIFPTRSKADPDPAQGLDGLRRARSLCSLPLVAVGGITVDNAADVLRTGADAVAVIGAIASSADPAKTMRELLRTAAEVAAAIGSDPAQTITARPAPRQS